MNCDPLISRAETIGAAAAYTVSEIKTDLVRK
jgi:hypothetical protein